MARRLPTTDDNTQTNINSRLSPTGTSRAAALRRLRKDRPDIHARVLAGELSPHAGMIEAGFRKRAVNPLSALDQIRKLIPRLTAEEREQLISDLQEHAPNGHTPTELHETASDGR
jgi:hypothetical protein